MAAYALPRRARVLGVALQLRSRNGGDDDGSGPTTHRAAALSAAGALLTFGDGGGGEGARAWAARWHGAPCGLALTPSGHLLVRSLCTLISAPIQLFLINFAYLGDR